MVKIEVKTTQSITNEQLGKYYAKFLREKDADSFYQDLACSIDMNVQDSITDFADAFEAVAELSWADITEVLQATVQYLKNILDGSD